MDYHRMVNMEGPLGNVTPTHWWKSPRWIVIRIEALIVVAIIMSFFLAAFGSCRRWSNRWIVQKGFFIAQVLSLSLGTYSLGLMQSSSVKSEMYPIWTVSLFALFGCIDPVTTYNGLDYKGPLSKVVYGICLNFGYVMVISIPTISSAVGKAAIITLSAITFIKSFHRSFALVQQNKIRDMVSTLSDLDGETCVIKKDEYLSNLDDFREFKTVDLDTGVSQQDIDKSIRNNKDKRLQSCYDVCVAFCLSHKLQRHILGLEYLIPLPDTLTGIDFEWALKVIDIELALVYDSFFTSNPFLHYYQTKTSSLWGLASLAGICFVMVATAIPEGMARRSGAIDGCSKVLGTTTADLATTFCILVSLALLQLTQLVWSWTSNWARAAVASSFSFQEGNENEWGRRGRPWRHLELSGWMRLKVFVATSTNLFDKYLWQDKIGQCPMLPELRLLDGKEKKGEGISSSKAKGEKRGRACVDWTQMFGLQYIWQVIRELVRQGSRNMKVIRDTATEDVPMWRRRRVPLVQTLGLHYIWQVIEELLSTKKTGGIKLDEDVKGSVIDFLGQLEGDTVDRNWLLSLPEEPHIRYFLPQFSAPQLLRPEDHCYRYIGCVLTWHIATWYCEREEQNKLAEQKSKEDAVMSKQVPICCGRKIAAILRLGNYFQKQRRGGEEGGTKTRDHRRVANALSQYCAYLVKSAPELLPGPVGWAKRVYDGFAREAKVVTSTTGWDREDINTMCGNLSERIFCMKWNAQMDAYMDSSRISNSKALAKLLMHGRSSDELWKTLALVWVQLLVYAAPYGNVESHMRRLSQGGEFITHLWALLYHLDIREWKVIQVVNNLHDISTIEDAQRILNRILNDDDHDLDIVVFFVESDYLEKRGDDFVTASKLVDGVKFYLTSSAAVAECLFPEFFTFRPGKVYVQFLNKAYKKITSYDSSVYETMYEPCYVAQFVYENKLASAKARAQETAPSTSHNPIPIEELRLEDGQTEVEITVEIQPDFSNTTQERKFPWTTTPLRPVNDNLHSISTVEDAQRILNDDNHDLDIVVFFADSVCPDGFVAASELVHGVKFYFTSSRDVAMCLYFPESILQSSKSILFLNKANKKITFYDPVVNGSYTQWDVAQFVYKNMYASAMARAQETAPSTSHTPIPVEEQRSEDGQTSTVVEIEEEIPPPS